MPFHAHRRKKKVPVIIALSFVSSYKLSLHAIAQKSNPQRHHLPSNANLILTRIKVSIISEIILENAVIICVFLWRV